MKKLIITMAAITSLALVAKAEGEVVSPKETFAGRSVGKMDISYDDHGSSNGTRWWTTTGATDSTRYVGDCAVVAKGTEGESDYNKYLLVDTDTPIQRKVAYKNVAVTDGPLPVAIPTGVGGYLTTSSKVQFTAADVAPDRSELGEYDKMAIFAIRASETDVRLAVMDITGVHTTEVVVVEDTWYNLKVVTTVTGVEGQQQAKFTVYLDETQVQGEFTSMTTSGTLSTVGFSGTGAVDDIGFEYVAGVAEEKAYVGVAESPWSEEAEASLYEVYVEYDFEQGSVSTGYSNPVEVMIGNSIPFYILLNVDPEGKQVTAAVDGVAVPCAQVTGSTDTWVVTYDTTGLVDKTSVTIVVSVTDGEDPDPTTVTVNISNPSVATFTATIGGREITSWPVTATVDDTIAITVTDSNYQTVTVGGANATFDGNTWTATYTVTGAATIEIAVTNITVPTVDANGSATETTVPAADADKAKEKVAGLMKPPAAASAVTDADYKAYFNWITTDKGDGTYTVTATGLNTGVVPAPAVAPASDADDATLAASLNTIAATAEAGNDVEVKVHNAKPGLYYTLKEGREANDLKQYSDSELATGATVPLTVTIKGGEKGFYRIVVTAAATEPDGSANESAKNVNAVEAVK